MGWKFGAIIGGAIGYYLGARAGRERYDELNRWIDRTFDTRGIENLADKAHAAIDLGAERAREALDHDPPRPL